MLILFYFSLSAKIVSKFEKLQTTLSDSNNLLLEFEQVLKSKFIFYILFDMTSV